MNIQKLLLLGAIFSYIHLPSNAQIKGRIFDQTTGQALVGASIINPQNEQGNHSDSQGLFGIEASDSLYISMLGYETQKIKVRNPADFLLIGLPIAVTQLNEVVISAYPTENKQNEIPSSIGIITARDLQRDNQVVMASAMNRIAGVYMHSGTFNTNRITIRGIGSRSLFGTNKIRAYLNDIPLTSGDGETTIEDIDMDLIERVEIIKGPNSSIYGSGLGGVVKLITQKADFQQTTLENKTILGSYGLWRNTTALRSSSANSNIHLLYNRTHSDGYRENNEFDRTSIGTMADFYAGEKHTIRLLLNYIQVKAFIPSSIDSATFASRPEAAAPTWAASQGYEDYHKLLFGLSHQFYFHKHWALHTSFFGNFRKNDELRPFNILKESSQNAGVRSYLNYTNTLGENQIHLTIGCEFFQEWYDWQTYQNIQRNLGDILSNNQENRSFYNAFLQTEFRFKNKITIQSGLNINETQYQYDDLFKADGDVSGNYRFKTVISPRLGVSYPFLPQHHVYATVSQGFSPPTLAETLTPSGTINPNIQPETGWNYEMGFKGHFATHTLIYEVNLYSMDIRNLLVARRTGDEQFVGINAGQTLHKGLEISLMYNILKAPQKIQLQAFANATITNYTFKDFKDGDHDYAGKQLTGTPKNTLNVGIDAQTLMGFYGNINFQFIDKMPLRDDNAKFSAAYSLLNLKLGYQKNLLKHLKCNIFGGINNLLDTHYAAMLLINATGNNPRYYYPGLPLNYFGGISLGYIF
jgi:iron complex outermembrane recepter protein